MRVHVIADLLEERWPSMDLVADMLMAHVGRNGVPVSPRLIRPSFSAGRSSLLPSQSVRRQVMLERVLHRLWTYPRWLRRQ